MLVIRADLVEAIVAHARHDHPDEACGVLAGPEGSDRPERHIPMVNAERSPAFYRFDSHEQYGNPAKSDSHHRGTRPRTACRLA